MNEQQKWTVSCETLGHIYNLGSDPEEESAVCLDCGEVREQ